MTNKVKTKHGISHGFVSGIIPTVFIIIAILGISSYVVLKKTTDIFPQKSSLLTGNDREIPDVIDIIQEQAKDNTPYQNPNEVIDGTVETYHSDELGVSFDYFQPSNTKRYQELYIEEIGNTIYLSAYKDKITEGYHVEVLSKDPNTSLRDTVQNKYLTGSYYETCIMTDKVFAKNDKYHNETYDFIAVIPANQEDYDNGVSFSEIANRCPIEYSAFHGRAYFAMDPKHPDKYLFFKIGQDNAGAGIPTPGAGGPTWDQTLRFD